MLFVNGKYHNPTQVHSVQCNLHTKEVEEKTAKNKTVKKLVQVYTIRISFTNLFITGVDKNMVNRGYYNRVLQTSDPILAQRCAGRLIYGHDNMPVRFVDSKNIDPCPNIRSMCAENIDPAFYPEVPGQEPEE